MATPEGRELYRRLELGSIAQQAWNEGFAALPGISGDNLTGRLLYFLDPAHDVLRIARQARAARVRTAVLSNSLGRDPYDLYARCNLAGKFDVVVLSDDCGLRKPDPGDLPAHARNSGTAGDRAWPVSFFRKLNESRC